MRQIFEKIARGEALNPSEQELFVRFGERAVEMETLLSQSVLPGSKSLQLNYPAISNPAWKTSALHALTAVQQNAVSIAHNTKTYVTFDEIYQFGEFWQVDAAKQKISFEYNGNRPFNLSGYAAWAGNSSGYRSTGIEAYDKNDNFLGQSTLHTATGHALTSNLIPFTLTWWFSDDTAYVKMYVFQTSGGNLNLEDYVFGITVA